MQNLFYFSFSIPEAEKDFELVHNLNFIPNKFSLSPFQPSDADIRLLDITEKKFLLKSNVPCRGFISCLLGNWRENKLYHDSVPCKTCFKLLRCKAPCQDYTDKVLLKTIDELEAVKYYTLP